MISRNWTIEYWADDIHLSSIEMWFDGLTMTQFKSVAKELKLLQCCGNQLRLPHSRSLGKGLFELRERKYGYRIYYAFDADKVIILLYAGDKNSQDKDIDIARERLAKLEII